MAAEKQKPAERVDEAGIVGVANDINSSIPSLGGSDFFGGAASSREMIESARLESQLANRQKIKAIEKQIKELKSTLYMPTIPLQQLQEFAISVEFREHMQDRNYPASLKNFKKPPLGLETLANYNVRLQVVRTLRDRCLLMQIEDASIDSPVPERIKVVVECDTEGMVPGSVVNISSRLSYIRSLEIVDEHNLIVLTSLPYTIDDVRDAWSQSGFGPTFRFDPKAAASNRLRSATETAKIDPSGAISLFRDIVRRFPNTSAAEQANRKLKVSAGKN